MVRFIKLSKIKPEDKLTGIGVILDDYIFKINILLFRRMLYILSSIIVIGAAFFASYFFINLFFHTSYRFVSLFLLFIMVSNILAKISIKYIKTYE